MPSRIVEFNLVLIIIANILMFPISARRAEAAGLILENRWDKRLCDGMDYSHFKLKVGNSGAPLHIFLVAVSLSRPYLEVQPIMAKDRLDSLETVGSMAARKRAAVAINGSFFNTKSSDPFPIGFLMIDGRTVYFSHLYRSAFGLTADKIPLFGYPRTKGIIYHERTGHYFPLWGMNGKRAPDEALVYTPEYGPSTGTNEFGREIVVSRDKVMMMRQGNSTIPRDGFVVSLHGESRRYSDWFQTGDKVMLYFVVDPAWLDVHNAITGGPLLVRGGRNVVAESIDENLKHGYRDRVPMTAVGSTADGRLLLVVADGRQKKYSVGVTYEELADFMISLGAVNAIGMDGGGSSTMWINGVTVNRPSDGGQRRVSNALAVFLKK